MVGGPCVGVARRGCRKFERDFVCATWMVRDDDKNTPLPLLMSPALWENFGSAERIERAGQAAGSRLCLLDGSDPRPCLLGLRGTVTAGRKRKKRMVLWTQVKTTDRPISQEGGQG